MTHKELLAKIDYYLVPTEKLTGDDKVRNSAIGFMKALRAVVELHKPEEDKWGLWCNGDEQTAHYPCPTIQAVEKELG